jgi:hypothetical protein
MLATPAMPLIGQARQVAAHPQVGADARCFFTANVRFRPEAWPIDESTIPRQRIQPVG